MSVNYRSIYPISNQATYLANQNVELVLNLNNEKLVPGTVALEGSWESFITTVNAGNRPQPTTRQMYDPLVGAHCLFRDITTEFELLGIVENFQNYPRYVKMKNLATQHDESLGTETVNAVELVVASDRIAKGLIEGQNALDYTLPFSVKLQNVLNKASGPLASAVTGVIRVRIRLAPNSEVYYGEDAGTSEYQLSNLRLRYQTIPDDGKRQPVQLQVNHSYRSVLDSNNVNVNTFVPGLSDSVAISFIQQSVENTATENYLACHAPPGIPPLGYRSASGTIQTGVVQDYGIERLQYAINDTDTALVGFTLESREEILHNALRAFKAPPGKYGALLRKIREPVVNRRDGYLAGIPFGGLLDFSKNKFACQIESQCDNGANLYAAYLYFRMLSEVVA